VVDGQPVPVADIGGVAFEVADRLAIINLFGAFAYAYDQHRLDDFRALFTESPGAWLAATRRHHGVAGRRYGAGIARGKERRVQGAKQPTPPRSELLLV
jgi:SnoaL-like domain